MLLVAVGGLALLAVIGTLSWNYADSSGLFMKGAGCSGHLRSIVMAAHLYHEDHGTFPPAYLADERGRPIHSWRVLLLPYLEQEDLYRAYRFDEPWDGPNNRKLADQVWSTFRCPFDAEGNHANYLAVVGPNTMWRGNQPVTLDSIRNATSETIFIVEVANSGIHWMEPRDLHVLQMAPGINPPAGQGISSNHSDGANVAFADGSARFLRNDTPLETLDAMLTIEGGETISLP